MTDPADTNAVGPGRPPKDKQFKKGKSGNPRGRPKGSLNFKTDLLDELKQAITINQHGEKRKVTKQNAMIKMLVAKALQGDTRAAMQVVHLIVKFIGVPTPEPESTPEAPLAEEDEALLNTFINYARTVGENGDDK